MENYPITHIPITKAMEILSFSRFKMYQLVKEGKLDIKKVGKKSFISVEQMNALFQDA